MEKEKVQFKIHSRREEKEIRKGKTLDGIVDLSHDHAHRIWRSEDKKGCDFHPRNPPLQRLKF
jgi:hypothetical protein